MKLEVAAWLAPLLAACTHVLAERDWRPRASPSDCEVRVQSHNQAGGFETVQYYDARGRLVSGTSRPTQDGRAWESFSYDARGRLVAISSQEERGHREGNCDVVGGCDEPGLRAIDRVDLEWDGGGRLHRRSHRREEYAARGGEYVRRRTTDDEIEYEYDQAGRLKTVDSGRLWSKLEYDAGGRPIRRLVEERGYPQRRYAIKYGADGRIASRESLGHTYVFRYDDQGRVVRRDTVGYPNVEHYETWEYDARGAVIRHLDTRVYPHSGAKEEHELALRYDEIGRLQEIRARGQPRQSFTYAGACNAVRIGPSPLDPMGQERCRSSPHGVLQTCWW